ncbi:hypothetical protein VTK26DRAFT_2787 [Humicola hyalothermophila]
MSEVLDMSVDAEMAEAPELNSTSAPGQTDLTEQQPLNPSEAQSQQQDVQTRQTGPSSEPSSSVKPPHAEPVAAAPSDQPSSSLPAAFPKKRRGRPPGRPNTTVRESDYDENPLVKAWNAAKGERAVPVVSIGIRDALTEQSLVHETQRAIFRLPSRETIHFVQGWITARHIASQRPSYVNGLLIHSRGQDAPVSCAQCVERRAKHALGPFLTCRVLPGSYHNSCSNCKWFDNTSACSLYTGPKPNRKRKAKEQQPPPPQPGAAPRSASVSSNGGEDGAVPAPTPAATGQVASPSKSQQQSHPPRPPEPDQQDGPALKRLDGHDRLGVPQSIGSPDVNRNNVEGEPGHDVLDAPERDSDSSDRSVRSGLQADEINGSELAAAPPSQADSLSDSPFLLPKSEEREGEDLQEVGGEDNESDFVASQLAAQLLPEIQRQDS